MRAPPEAEQRMSGRRSAIACSHARAMRSPVPVPRLPPMNEKSITPSITGMPPIVAVPITTLSFSPLFAITESIFALYAPDASWKSRWSE